ncbi:MAG: hypothetical protein IKP68_07405, partial [Clostridia bacterium]|nr:hypothetical protein [Clostridia bacterium]
MPNEEYLKAARKLLRGITKKDLLTAENRKRIVDMVNAEELELWEINDDILSLKILRGDLIEESATYDQGITSYKPLREHRYKESGTDYTWMYQQKETPEYLEDFNDYFIKAITEKNDAYFTAFLHFYESVLNSRVESYIERYYLNPNLMPELKQTFVLVMWEQMLKYDPADPIPLLQKAESVYKKAWHAHVSKNVGAVSMPEKKYALMRSVAQTYRDALDMGLSQREAEEKVFEQYADTKRSILKEILQMLPAWRDALPIVNREAPRDNYGYEERCTYEECLYDAYDDTAERIVWRKEIFKVFKSAAEALSWKEKDLFEKINGIDLTTMEVFTSTDRETLALTHNYADESGVRKAELDVYEKLTAELCKIGFADAVSVKKVSAPKDYPKGKHLIYYAYYPMCGKDGGLMVINTMMPKLSRAFQVLRTAEDDAMNSHRYATLAAKGLEEHHRKSADGSIPARILVARYAHTPTELGTPEQKLERWSTVKTHRYVSVAYCSMTTTEDYSAVNFFYYPEGLKDEGEVCFEIKNDAIKLYTAAIPFPAPDDIIGANPYGERALDLLYSELRGRSPSELEDIVAEESWTEESVCLVRKLREKIKKEAAE